MTAPPLTLEFHALGQGTRQALIDDVRAGLGRQPKELPPRWFYDDRGSELFELITELPEYYQTRTEAAILRQCDSDVVQRVQPRSILELGAGASTKTRLLIEAAHSSGELRWFQPFAVSDAIVQRAARDMLRDFPGLTIHAAIGNFFPDERLSFLSAVRQLMGPEDAFLLGVDLVKDPLVLEAAYDDAQGVTAQFNLNVLSVINRELQADFDLGSFRHVACYDRENQWIEMHLRSLGNQIVHIPGAGFTAEFKEGELMRTEISAKFTRQRVDESFAQAGLRTEAWYTDREERFALALAVPEER